MGKIDLYRNVHKGQRARLFVLTVDIGRLDYTQPATVAGCMMRLRAMIDELREHGVHEERFIHPLLHAHAPAVAEMLEADHASFDQRLAELEALAARLEAGVEPLEVGSELYRTLCSTLSGYLAHLDYEETVAMPALWRACTPDALGGVILDFNASRGDAERLHDLHAQIGAL
ncbi:MAG TPA: hemerythrin domain-containing protein, partial [Gammaproteobacteria bacterium]|nr:hemerythrin domain-containing protein [Gammaproteobacteria bacterium]